MRVKCSQCGAECSIVGAECAGDDVVTQHYEPIRPTCATCRVKDMAEYEVYYICKELSGLADLVSCVHYEPKEVEE